MKTSLTFVVALNLLIPLAAAAAIDNPAKGFDRARSLAIKTDMGPSTQRFAGHSNPEGPKNVVTADSRRPEGSGNVVTADYRRPEGAPNQVTTG